jgi:hypothetical protein
MAVQLRVALVLRVALAARIPQLPVMAAPVRVLRAVPAVVAEASP